MVRKMEGELSDTWLAVIDGRFLPVDEMSIRIEANTQDVISSASMRSQRTVRTAELMEGSIQTNRKPFLKREPCQLRLYGPDEEYFIHNLFVQYQSVDGWHTIEFQATEWGCRKR